MTHSDPIIEALIKRIEALETKLANHETNHFYPHSYVPYVYQQPNSCYPVGYPFGNIGNSIG